MCTRTLTSPKAGEDGIFHKNGDIYFAAQNPIEDYIKNAFDIKNITLFIFALLKIMVY